MATWPSPLHCYIDIWVIQSGLHPCYLSFGVISVVNSGSTAPSSFPHELPGQIISLCRCLCHEGDCPQKALTVAHVNTPPPAPLNRHTPTPIFAICHPAVVNTCLGDISSSLSFALRSVDKKLLFLVYSVFVN